MKTTSPYLRRVIKDLKVRNADIRIKKPNSAKNLLDEVKIRRIIFK